MAAREKRLCKGSLTHQPEAAHKVPNNWDQGMRQPDDNAGPTAERLAHAIDGEGKDAVKFWDLVGRAKSNRKFTMRDDALGRVWMRQKISGEEYSALKRFALHWLAGGLQGPGYIRKFTP